MEEVLRGDLHIDCAIGSRLFVTYRDRTASTTFVQDVLYAGDLGHWWLQHMLEVLDRASTRWGVCISVSKTEILQLDPENNNLTLSSPSPFKAKH